MKDNYFDVIVIGGGAAGLTASKLAAGLGKSVLLIEKEGRLGGECTWTGCVPSKTLVHQAKIAKYVSHLSRFGLRVNDPMLNTEKVFAHIQKVVQSVSTTHTKEQLEALGITVVFGHAQFSSRTTVVVGKKQFQFGRCILATGGRPAIPAIEGLNTVDYLTNRTLFDCTEVPRSLCSIGGGPTGVEVGSALARLGSTITILEAGERLISWLEPEVSDYIQAQLQGLGATVQCRARVHSVSQQSDGVHVSYAIAQKEHTVVAQKVLVVTGRKPNIDSLELDAAGIVVKNGALVVDEYLCTSNPLVYACGDIIGPIMLSHFAWYQATVAAQNACIPWWRKRKGAVTMIGTLFTQPECSLLGMTITQARRVYGDTIRIYRCGPEMLDRAIITGQTQGMGIIITDASWKILGATLMLERSGELISELAVAQQFGVPLYKLMSVIHPYPSYAELLWHVSKRAYVDWLNSRWYVRIAKKLFGVRSLGSKGA